MNGDVAVTGGAGEIDGTAVVEVVGVVTSADGDCDGAGRDVTDWDGAGVRLAGDPELLVWFAQPDAETSTTDASKTCTLMRENLVLIAHLLSTHVTLKTGAAVRPIGPSRRV
jgi:hypothetical protein